MTEEEKNIILLDVINILHREIRFLRKELEEEKAARNIVSNHVRSNYSKEEAIKILYPNSPLLQSLYDD